MSYVPYAQDDILKLLNLTVEQLDALRAITPAQLAMLKTLAISGNTGAQATIQAYTQVVNVPSGPLPTSNAQPYGLTLATPGPAILDLTFGKTVPGNTVPDRETFARYCATRDLLGDINNVTSQPNDGIPNNWEARYRDYPAFLSDGVTRDPRDLHPIYDDHMELIVRSHHPYSSDPTQYEMGYMRPLVRILPGMFTELCAQWPGGDDAVGTWPVNWYFSGDQPLGTKTVYEGPLSLEIDAPDGFQEDGAIPGSTIRIGAPIYAFKESPVGSGNYVVDPAPYDNPFDIYVTDGPNYVPSSLGDGIDLRPAPEKDPTTGYHYYGLDWRDPNTIIWTIDGEVVRVRHCKYSSTYQTTNDGSAIPPELVGKTLPLYPQISLQFVPVFNPIDKATVHAKSSVRAAYKIKHYRVWGSPTTAAPNPPTPDVTGTPMLGSQAMRWVNKGQARAQGGAGAPLVLRAASTGNGDTHGLVQPMAGTVGSYTVRMRQVHPGVDNYRVGVLLQNSATGAQGLIDALYPGPQHTFFTFRHSAQADIGAEFNVAESKSYTFARIGRDYYIRVIYDGTNYAVYGSMTGAAGTWQAMSTHTAVEWGTPDSIGVYVAPFDGAQHPGEARCTLTSLAFAGSTDPQAAA